MNKQRSFTLIELLVVIVIIGILSGVIVIATSNFINSTSNTKLVAELSTLAKALESLPNYPTGSFCLEDTSQSQNFLNALGMTKPPMHPEYKAGQTSKTTNNCFLYISEGEHYSIRVPTLGNKGYLIQESRNPQTKDIQKSCEPGWVPFGNRCVMQYEPKAMNKSDNTIEVNLCVQKDGSGNIISTCSTDTHTAVSVQDGMPWVGLTQKEAKKACEDIGAHLITNAEWMAIARDIEATASNWKNGELVGETQGLFLGMIPEQTFTLSNGEIVWNMAGILWEWVDKVIPTETGIKPAMNGVFLTNIIDITDWGNTGLKYEEMGALDNTLTPFENRIGGILYNSNNNSPSAFVRGGFWDEVGGVFFYGIFDVILIVSPLEFGQYTFRCVKE